MDAEDASLFIDRSPLAFRFVLNHLRGEPLKTDTMTALEKEILILDAHYYELSDLIAELGEEEEEVQQEEEGYMDYPTHPHNKVITRCLNDAWEELDKEQRAFRREVFKREHLEEKIKRCFGGKRVRLQLQQEELKFSTRMETLRSRGGMLEAKFREGSNWEADVYKDGSIFIDKDGHTFEFVLNMLRGYPTLKSLTPEMKKAFEYDLEYFALEK